MQMTLFAKFTLKTFANPPAESSAESRRGKLVAAIETQKLVLAAARKGEAHWQSGKNGKRAVRPWFTAQDGGYYVQCRYGARPLLLDGKNNAVFVSKLDDIGPALDAFTAAAQSGALDEAISAIASRKKA